MQALEKLRNRMMGMLVRGVLKSYRDTNGVVVVQIKLSADEVRDDLELVEPFGMASRPVKGGDVVVLFVGGDRGHGIAQSLPDRRYRPNNLGDGQSCLYDAYGTKVWLKSDGTVEIAGSSDAAALASKVDTEINRLWTVLTGWTVVPADGGAALKTAATTAAASKLTVASTKVKMS